MENPVTDNGTANLLQAFDRLFERAAAKLNIEYTDEERKDIRESFEERFRDVIKMLGDAGASNVADREMREMEAAIDGLSMANIAGYLAVSPLAVHVQKVIKTLAAKAAEQRLLEHLINQTDDRYGGN